jgi:hypothetical protein
MNSTSLSELIRVTNKQGIFAKQGLFADSQIETAYRFLKEYAADSICFDIGHADNLRGIGDQFIDYMPNMPYETSWFEVIDKTVDSHEICQIGALVREDKKDFVRTQQFCFFIKFDEEKIWQFIGMARIKGGDKIIETQLMTGTIDGFCRPMVNFVYIACDAMNKSNAELIESPPSKTKKIMASRKSKKLFSTWTVIINTSRYKKSEAKGGTHASPRMHTRRGHKREYSPGKYTWVNPCVVKGSTDGMIFKDYRVKIGD